MLVRMSLARIVIVDSHEEQASMVVLRETEGERAFPILIGLNEAYAIERRTHGRPVPRPMTHELLERVIEQLNGQLEQVVINELRDQTFYAKLVVRCNGTVIEVDSRPSDAMALCAGTDTPIYVDESVFEELETSGGEA